MKKNKSEAVGVEGRGEEKKIDLSRTLHIN